MRTFFLRETESEWFFKNYANSTVLTIALFNTVEESKWIAYTTKSLIDLIIIAQL